MNNKIKCLEIKSLIHLYIDQALPQDISKKVEEHLGTCSICQEEQRSWEEVFSSLNSVKPTPVPDNLTQKIMMRVSKEKIQPSGIDSLRRLFFIPRYSFRIAGSLATAAIIIFFAFTFIFNTPDISNQCIDNLVKVDFALQLSNGKVRSVAIVGDFNNWNPSANQLKDVESNGIWSTALTLGPGRYEYMFIVDGEKWITDPNAYKYTEDGFGNKNAIIELRDCT